jgi:MATE family, multidrug efflux pump
MATVITRAVGLGIGVVLLYRLNAQMEFTRQAEPDICLMRRILRVAVPNMVQSGVRSVAYLVMYIIIASYGTLALSAFGIVSRIEMLALMPGFGIATAAAVMVGQNLGAGHPDRSEESVWKALTLYGSFMAVITVLFLTFGAGLTEFFDPSGLSDAYAVSYFYIVSPFYVLIAVAIVLSFALNGAGDTKKPMYATLLSYVLVQVPLALILPDLTGTGIVGVWYAMATGILVQTVALYLMFRSGKWKNITI